MWTETDSFTRLLFSILKTLPVLLLSHPRYYITTWSNNVGERHILAIMGDLTEGFLRYRFGGLIFGRAYTWRGLFSEFYGTLQSRLLDILIQEDTYVGVSTLF